MADQPTAVAKPPFDPSPILDALKSIVVDNKSPGGGGKSWISTAIIVLVVMVAIAVWAWISFTNNRELAKLRHDREVQRIRAEKAVIDAKVATNDVAIAAAQKQVVVLTEQLKHIDGDIRTEQERYAANLRAIDRIHSWRDVDPSFR